MLRYDMLNATGILSVVGPVDSPRMLTLGWGAEGGGAGGGCVYTACMLLPGTEAEPLLHSPS